MRFKMAPVVFFCFLVGIYDDDAFLAVYDEKVFWRYSPGEFVQSGDGGNVQRTRKNCCMGGVATFFRRKPQDFVAFEMDGE
jgi:hypothetical protein